MSTEKNFQDKVLTDTDRKYVVQTLATMIMTYTQKPTFNDCKIVARSLVNKYNFLTDMEGDGEVSYLSCMSVLILY